MLLLQIQFQKHLLRLDLHQHPQSRHKEAIKTFYVFVQWQRNSNHHYKWIAHFQIILLQRRSLLAHQKNFWSQHLGHLLWVGWDARRQLDYWETSGVWRWYEGRIRQGEIAQINQKPQVVQLSDHQWRNILVPWLDCSQIYQNIRTRPISRDKPNQLQLLPLLLQRSLWAQRNRDQPLGPQPSLIS